MCGYMGVRLGPESFHVLSGPLIGTCGYLFPLGITAWVEGSQGVLGAFSFYGKERKMPRRSELVGKECVRIYMQADDTLFWENPDPEDEFQSLRSRGVKATALVEEAEFRPNLALLVKEHRDALAELGRLTWDLDQRELRLFMLALADAYKLRSTSFKFGEKAYWCSSSSKSNYLDQWFECVVIGYDKSWFTLAASLTDGVNTIVRARKGSIKNVSAFRRHKRQLIKDGLERTPARERSGLVWEAGDKDEFAGGPPGLAEIADELAEAGA